MEANALVGSYVLKTLLEIKPNNNELNRASEIYENLGLVPYILRIKANIALTHLWEKDSIAAYGILKELLENPELKKDKSFYSKVVFDLGLVKKSPEYMAIAAEKAKDHDKVLEMICRWYEGQFYKLNGNHYRADSIYKSLLPVVNNCSHELKSYIFYDNAKRLEKEGKKDSALLMIGKFLAEEDTLKFVARRDEMIRIDTANRLREYEERASRDRREERLKWLAAVLAILVFGLTGYILLSGRLRKERISKRKVETELDNKTSLLESEQRALMSQGLAMTEKDNVLQSVSDHVSRLEKEGTLSHGEARKLDADIRLHLNGRQEWDDFKELFSKVHPAFADEIAKRYPKITEGDVRLAVYIKAGLSTKQIARMLMVQPSSVKMNRHRLRERMGLASDKSLEDALRDINVG